MQEKWPPVGAAKFSKKDVKPKPEAVA